MMHGQQKVKSKNESHRSLNQNHTELTFGYSTMYFPLGYKPNKSFAVKTRK